MKHSTKEKQREIVARNKEILVLNKVMERIQEFCLMDDEFMSKVFEDIECATLLLRIILNKKDLQIISVCTEHYIKNLQGRSIRMDVRAVDSVGIFYNIEIQRSDAGAVAKRARYNSSLIDANITQPGDDYEKLPESYVIFITENDVHGKGYPIYHIDRRIEETGELFGDKAHILYVNGKIKNDSELGKLMHDFYCKNPDDMYYKELRERTRYFKEDREGVKMMSRIMEELASEVEKDTKMREKSNIACALLERGKDSYEEIARLTGLSIEEVENLGRQYKE